MFGWMPVKKDLKRPKISSPKLNPTMHGVSIHMSCGCSYLCVFVDACGLLCLPLTVSCWFIHFQSVNNSESLQAGCVFICLISAKESHIITQHQNKSLTCRGWLRGEVKERQEGKGWRKHRRQGGYTVTRGVSVTAVNPLQGLVSCQTSWGC